MDISTRIKEVRLNNKMTMREFSSLISIDNSQYSKIENGKLNPTISQLMEISSKFNISLDWLITGSDKRDTKIIEAGRETTSVNEYEIPMASGNLISERGSEYLSRSAHLEKENNDLTMKINSLEIENKSLKEVLKEKQSIINEQDAIIQEKNQIIKALKSKKE